MRKVLLAALLFAVASPALAQSTAVTATVRDSSNIPYSFARVSAQLIPAGTAPTVNGRQVDATAFTQADVNGNINFNLWDNTVVMPGGTQWQITVCETPGVTPPLGTGSQCFTITATISGAAQSLTTAMNAAAPALTYISLSSPPAAGSNGQMIYNNAGVYGGTLGLTWDAPNRRISFVNAGNSAFASLQPGTISFASLGGTIAPRISNVFSRFDMLAAAADDIALGQAGNGDHMVLPGNDFGRENLGTAATLGSLYLNDGTTVGFQGPALLNGVNSPEGSATARVGSIYMNSNGGPGTAAWIKQLGTGPTGWTPLNGIVGTVTLLNQTMNLGPTTIVTSAAVDSLYHVDTSLVCKATSAAATVLVTIAYTDTSSTAQTISSVVATCTALGAASVSSLSTNISAKASTTISYTTTIANTPTYDVRIAVTKLI